jgi:acetyl-CoA C-acetyltransferase/acetyl-CoA acyltransferase
MMREAVILDAIRTPLGRRGRALKDVHPNDLLGHLLTALIERNKLDPARVDDVIAGCVSQVGEQSANIGRNAWLSAGLPESVPAVTIDRQCGSSLQALHFAAQGIMAGSYDLAIACGVEAMSRIPLGQAYMQGPGTPLNPKLAARYEMDGGWFDQARGAELIAQQWELSRPDLDRYSVQSHQRAAAAWQAGHFSREVLPMPGTDLQQDEGVRASTSLEQVAALKPAFPGLNMITAGNSSQITDGASAVLVAERSLAEKLELQARARFVAFSAVGVNPITMLTGPIPATHTVLERSGLSLADIDLYEVNEAFASVPLIWQREFGADVAKLNVNGGAIAIGHPVGATGTRIVATLLHELERRRARYGLIAICEGGGLANGTIIEALR